MNQISLVSCKGLPAPPEGSTYIGRAVGKYQRAPLSNPFKWAEHGEAALGMCRLHFARCMVEADARVLDALADLAVRHVAGPVTLACWCVTRPAEPCWRIEPMPARPCHGDLVASLVTSLGTDLRGYARATNRPEWWRSRVLGRMGKNPLTAVLFEGFGLRATVELAAAHPDVTVGLPPSAVAYAARLRESSSRAPA